MNQQQRNHRHRTDYSLSHLEWGGGLNDFFFLQIDLHPRR